MMSSASRKRSSSGRKPRSPPASALSVPCPSPVRAKDPWSSIRARSGVPPTSPRTSRPMRHAPAVCDDDGPTMTGPMMSSSETMALPRLLPRRSREQRMKMMTGVRTRDLGDFLRRSLRDDVSAARAAFGSEIDDPVGCLDHVEIVLDDENGVPLLHETVEHLEEQPDILE